MDSSSSSSPLASPVLSQIPKAQDAFMRTIANYANVDTNDLLAKSATLINGAIDAGRLAATLMPIEDPMVAEKLSLQLKELGYATGVVQVGSQGRPDGSTVPVLGVQINWLWSSMPYRDAYSV
jgi:hypothetical protein